ncbi:hypothetical protein [Tahibacter amnicola]|uniref:Uncharacterized protein n=1 Tax=Tahibacter amnicola TaxID=2976241 RepID=A0ABY6B7J3_9GAMM|nr:hypothetical protein [Tahibacter amnicola]UXI65865.1 hypothetical protein N4264_13965 [Tahibacter amnicola]
MIYSDGNVVILGDEVLLRATNRGVVVAVIDEGEFSFAFRQSEWMYLQKGVLIDFPALGLMHFEDFDPDLQLLARAGARGEH